MDKIIEVRGMLLSLSLLEQDSGKYDAIEHAISLIDTYIEEVREQKLNEYLRGLE